MDEIPRRIVGIGCYFSFSVRGGKQSVGSIVGITGGHAVDTGHGDCSAESIIRHRGCSAQHIGLGSQIACRIIGIGHLVACRIGSFHDSATGIQGKCGHDTVSVGKGCHISVLIIGIAVCLPIRIGLL